MYLFFDTETTGLPKSWKAPVTDLDNWPRLVQLAYLYYEEDGTKTHEANYIVKPKNFDIPTVASAVHGITTERAEREGQDIELVLKEFDYFVERAKYLVAHNIAFDEKIVGSELLRNGMKNTIHSKSKICTMQISTDICKIEGPYGYKWPKLSELHYQLFKTKFEEAHNASADIEATAKCFWELMRMGKIRPQQE